MFNGFLPCLTRGPFSLFYGGAAIIPQLSSESAGNHTAILFLISTVLHISMIIYKKIKMNNLSIQQMLKKVIVSNFLNVYNQLIIFFVLLLLTIFLLYHNYIIEKNSTATKTEIQKSPEMYWKHLVVMALVETMFQSFSFF